VKQAAIHAAAPPSQKGCRPCCLFAISSLSVSLDSFVLESREASKRLTVYRSPEWASRRGFLCYILTLCLFLPCRKLQLPGTTSVPWLFRSPKEWPTGLGRGQALSDDTTRRFFWTP